VDPIIPREAQRIVAAYLTQVETHASADIYPCSVGDLPQSKEIIRAAFKTCVATLAATCGLSHELREYLEVAYVSLADYVSEECLELLRDYGRAGEELAADRRLARDKTTTDAWRRLTEQSRLAGQLAQAISDEADRLRAEFRSWASEAPAAAS
jgi:hypothetical protein